MSSERAIGYAFLVSLTAHCLFLGMPGFNVSSSKSDEPDDILIEIVVEKPPLLPDIDVMGEEKKLKSDLRPETDNRPQTTDIRPQATDFGPEDSSLKSEVCSLRSDVIEVVDPAREATLRYQDMVKQRIEEVRRYPPFARKHGIEGSACLGFVILPDGLSRDIRLIRSSGSRLLDGEAIATVERANPFPPVPGEISDSAVQMELSIVFAIK